MTTYYILEEEHVYGHYSDEGGGGGTHKRILAVDTSEQALMDRWNAHCQKEADKVKDKHPSYARNLPQPFEFGETRVSYNGSTGGGYASSRYYVTIKPFQAFDQI